ncbi:YeiH family protein [Blastochloris viridis]|uniref:Putative membrane protein YeiH n=1 Tax=Blastochloris viridis TaxID=1079 RepID=A0A0H5BFD1_BLAVI|nr:putative sulfate exporter family transporter [Blastochloris viridis]ALK09230.1 hypothetical protein BVIR_1447 [Blastochloris viridis]BAS00903.1 putative membrane protein YeiH [Blastochloris viridis]CUU41893.1 hypothetical protein BVIRIDIS_08920 [Blastochloris viridis]
MSVPPAPLAALPAQLRPAAGLLPGLALTGAVAGAAALLHLLPGLGDVSPMILAIVLGIAVRNLVGTPNWARAGFAFAVRRVLRFAIVLLGLQLTTAQVAAVGAGGLAIIAASLAATFLVTLWLGRLLKVERDLAVLIGAGTSICGASAVIAANTAVNASDEDVAYAVASVTVFGSLAMVLFPLVPGLLGLTPHAYGLWTGAAIHEIAQVVAAAFQGGPAAGEFGTVAKLTRVMMLAPLVLALAAGARRRGERRQAPLPWFVAGFAALVALNSTVAIPAEVKAPLVAATPFLLSVALAAMGLETDVRRLAAKGLGPLWLGLFAALFIAGFSLVLVMATM